MLGMANTQTISGSSGDLTAEFVIDWDTHRWTAAVKPDEGDFPFVGHVGQQRFELYSDGTFNEEEK
jgi:hypothetical protein